LAGAALKTARSTVGVDLTIQSVLGAEDQNQIVLDMMQNAADASLSDWFGFTRLDLA
jgi:hypothetical protein